jgi:hypothetical protein
MISLFLPLFDSLKKNKKSKSKNEIYVNRCRHMREQRCSRFSYEVGLVCYVVGLVCEYLPEGAHIGKNTNFIACINS